VRGQAHRWAPGIALAAVLVSGAACSLLTTDVSDCETDAECRNAFGFASVCGEGGFCRLAAASPRCNRTFPPRLLEDRLAHKDFIPVGSIFARDTAGVFANMENAVRLAFKHANDDGGVSGRNFGLVMCTNDPEVGDGLSGAAASVEVARYLTEEIGVTAIAGPATSDNTLAVFQSVRDRGVLVVSPSATAVELSALDPIEVSDESPGLLWRTAPPDSIQAAAMANDMRTVNLGSGCPGGDQCRVSAVQRVAVVHIEGLYGNGLATSFAEEFTRRGGTVDLLPFATVGQRDNRITEAPLIGGVEEILYISNDPERDISHFFDATPGIQAYDGKGIFLSEAGADPSIFGSVDSTRLPQVRGTRPRPLDLQDDLVFQRFVVSYQGEYNVSQAAIANSPFAANAYDAGWLIAIGAAWATFQEDGDLRGRNMARGLRKISGGAVIEVGPSGWVLIQQQFEAGRSINLVGASGNLDYSPETEETTAPIEVWTVEGTAINPRYTFTPPP
jgi:ABC-type branched-subunit amino acid transport system substrate-binding protein